MYTDRYIRVRTASEYYRLLEYWRANYPNYEIIYAVYTESIVATDNRINSLFSNCDEVLIAYWKWEDVLQIEVDITILDKIIEHIRRQFDSVEILDSTDIE